MQHLYCANEQCRKHTVHTGGKFIYSLEKRCILCEDCFHAPTISNATKDPYWFTTTHFNGEAIEVKGRRHLRWLEQQYGCSSHIANYDSKNWNTPPPVKPMPMGPELAEMIAHRTQPERGR